MRHFPLLLIMGALTCFACDSFVRPAVDAGGQAGPSAASLVDLNGGLAVPGINVVISPNVVATSPKVYLRKDKNNPPNCYYGVFASDPHFLPGGDAGVQPDNGLLLVSVADPAALVADGAHGSCPAPAAYDVGGGIPDAVQPGDVLEVIGQLTPYCDSFDTRAEECAVPIFPELTVSHISDLNQPDGGAAALPIQPAPLVVAPSQIADGSGASLSYAAMLLEVDDVTITDAHPDAYTAVLVSPGNLWLDTFDSRASVPQVLGQHFSKVIGELHFGYGHWRLEPRTPADLQN